MSNNTSNYQEYTFSNLLEQYDKILVPMIQRDYAQGRTDKKAADVRNNLLNDIFSSKDIHFDLIFGSKERRIIDGVEKNCFIPVDGQQRLTTLFLLYLYGLKAGKTNIEFDLSKFSYDTRRAASDFCESITSVEWTVQEDKKVSDVIKDSSWFMNYWEKDPTVEGMLNMLDAIHEKCKVITDYPNLNKVTFFFFDLESNGLNENLYLKMNSRGKPLTAFENLKAKIEKVLPEDVEIEDKCFPECDASPKDSFKAKWKYFMDRNWTEAFWDSTNSDKYDVSIAKFIVRFLAGYWAAFGQKTDEKTTAEDLKKVNKKEQNDKNYSDYIPFKPIKAVLKLDDAFPSLAYALTTAPKIAPYWTNDAIKISDKSEYKFLAVIFTYVLFDGDKDAMRFAWNMAENYVTEYDTFVTYCKRAGEIYKRNNNLSFYQALSSIKFDGNTSDQMKEEIAKAKQILLNKKNENEGFAEKDITDAEKHPLLKGSISALFENENCEKVSFGQSIQGRIKLLDKLWNEGDDKDYTLVKVLISLYDKEKPESKFYLKKNLENWKSLVTDKLKDSFRKIEQEDKKEECAGWKHLLVNTNLIENSRDSGKIVSTYWDGKVVLWATSGCTWNAYENVILDNVHNNSCLAELVKENIIECNQHVNNCDFFWGWDIRFKYKESYFVYYNNNTICLMDDNWNGKKLKDSTKPDIPENNFYFPVSENESNDSFLNKNDSFLNKLECLIAQAYPDADKHVCEGCHNKICVITTE